MNFQKPFAKRYLIQAKATFKSANIHCEKSFISLNRKNSQT